MKNQNIKKLFVVGLLVTLMGILNMNANADVNLNNKIYNKTWATEYFDKSKSMKKKLTTIEFNKKNNNFSGKTTCNGFSGGIVFGNNKLMKTSNLAATMMICPEEAANKGEREFFLRFNNKFLNYSLNKNTLTIDGIKFVPLQRAK